MVRLTLATVALVTILLVACGDDDTLDPTQTPAPTEEPPAAAPSDGGTPVADGTPAEEATPALTGLPDVSLERVFPALSFARMTGMYPAPDGGWWVTEQAGRITRVDDSGRTVTVLDITDRVSTDGNEEGLLGLAFAPDFEESGDFFAYYSASNPRRSVLSSFVLSAGDSPGVETIRLEVEEPYSNHNGGQIAFGPDGYLYVGLGDGGSGRDPHGNGQNPGTLLGSLLRIDVSGSSGYSVPPDNPFVDQAGARGEIWAYGLRNPWRFSFDTETGDLWLGDVGQNAREEIDLIVKGGNYGWNVMEGTQCLGGGSCDQRGLIAPVIDYPNPEQGCSVTGGFVYRGSNIAGLQGAYVYSDYCSGTIWALRADESGQLMEHAQIGEAGFRVSSFAQGPEGELYLLDHGGDGGIYKLVP